MPLDHTAKPSSTSHGRFCFHPQPTPEALKALKAPAPHPCCFLGDVTHHGGAVWQASNAVETSPVAYIAEGRSWWC